MEAGGSTKTVAVAVFSVLSDASAPHASERAVPELQSTIYISDRGDDKKRAAAVRPKTSRYALFIKFRH
jgi:hypothetical protein